MAAALFAIAIASVAGWFWLEAETERERAVESEIKTERALADVELGQARYFSEVGKTLLASSDA